MPRPTEKCLKKSQKLSVQGLTEPGPGVLPVPESDGPGETKNLARFIDGEPAEEMKSGDFCRDGVFRCKAVERIVQRKNEVGMLGKEAGLIEQFDPHASAGSLRSLFSRA